METAGMILWMIHNTLNFRYIESAETYAQTQASFEEVTLKFIKLDNKEALKTFLLRKLISLRPQVIFFWYFPAVIYQVKGILIEEEYSLTLLAPELSSQ